MPWDIERIVAEVKQQFPCPIAIHTHNDGDLAVVNALAAVKAGATQVQGTINGYGELWQCQFMFHHSKPPAEVGYQCLEPKNIRSLTEVSHFVAEIANMPPNGRQPLSDVPRLPIKAEFTLTPS